MKAPLRDHGSFIGRDSLGERLRGHAFLRKGGCKKWLVFGDGTMPLHQCLERHVHLAGGLDWTERLLFESSQPAVPHKDCAPRGIDDSR